jgi:hypothetical protein
VLLLLSDLCRAPRHNMSIMCLQGTIWQVLLWELCGTTTALHVAVMLSHQSPQPLPFPLQSAPCSSNHSSLCFSFCHLFGCLQATFCCSLIVQCLHSPVLCPILCAMLCRAAAAAQQLCQVLNDMHATKSHLADRFELGGPQHRSTGSHGIVEFAKLPGNSARFYFELCWVCWPMTWLP